MSYLDSAMGLTISRERAVIELKRHGVTSTEEINRFLRDMGTRETYDAQAVLAWLGY